MNELLSSLVLAYFKEKQASYSYKELAKYLGVSVGRLNDMLDELIDKKLLFVTEQGFLTLTQEGRLEILDSLADYYSFDIVNEESIFKEPWPIDRAYAPEKFLSKH